MADPFNVETADASTALRINLPAAKEKHMEMNVFHIKYSITLPFALAYECH